MLAGSTVLLLLYDPQCGFTGEVIEICLWLAGILESSGAGENVSKNGGEFVSRGGILGVGEAFGDDSVLSVD